jgi:uncharacterized protein (TIGR02145 family)
MARYNISALKNRSVIVKIPDLIIVIPFLCGTLFLNSCVKDPTIPVLITNPATDITTSTVTITGKINCDGGSPVTVRGICWGTSFSPTVDGSHTTEVEDSVIFSATITDLDPNTIYHARAFAGNSVGTAYGNDVMFTTSIAAPEVTTTGITEIMANTAISGGKITYDGGSTITAKGICWSASPDPDLSDSFTTNGTDTSRYQSTMTSLLPGTKYYVRAYAKNSAYTVYGEELTFNTKIADVDGNLYRTVTIGSQVWMAENLKTTKYKDNTAIPNIINNTEWINLSVPAYCWLGNDIQYKEVYGALYNWYTVNTGKLCPGGWHVPSDYDFKVLELGLGMSSDQVNLTDWRGTNQGAQVKSTTGWAESENGTNTSGFSALPGGYRYAATGAFNGIDMLTYWWSSDFTTDYGWYRRVDGTNNGIFRGATSKKGGKYVRCLKD